MSMRQNKSTALEIAWDGIDLNCIHAEVNGTNCQRDSACVVKIYDDC